MKSNENSAWSVILATFLFAVCTASAAIPAPIDPAKSDHTDTTAQTTTVTITVTPERAAVTATTQTQQFTSSPTNVTWSVDGVVGGNTTVGTISTTGLYTPPATAGNHTITAASGTSKTSASIAVTNLTGVLTYHNDASRDGINALEFGLTPATVTTATFGKLFSCTVDGAVYGQPLWVKGLTIGGGVHNVIFVATENDSAYAFDADANPCVTYWHVNLLDTLHGGTTGEHPVTWNDVGYCYGDVYPQVGVTSTPVIYNNTIYLVSASEKAATNSGNCANTTATFFHRLHALSLLTGSEEFDAPVTIAASVPGTGDGSVNGIVSFTSQLQHQRAGLAEYGGTIFLGFASHEDATPYHGWLLGYQATDVQQQVAVFNSTPNGLNGADGGFWAGGGAPAIGLTGDLFVATGNGVFDEAPPPPDHDYGDSVLRLRSMTGTTPNGENLSVAGWFTPFDQATLAENDTDLGSGSPVLLPTQTTEGLPAYLLVQVGKDGNVYLINRNNLGQYNASSNDQIVQSFRGPANGLWGMPALWQNNLYVGGQGDSLRQFVFDPSTGQFNPSVASLSSHVFGYPGTTPSVSSSAGSNGIVWTIDSSLYGYASPNASVNCSVVPVPAACAGPAILHAYDAGNLAIEYWNSAMAANSRDRAAEAVKFVPPTIANGKVYVATRIAIFVYGLLPN
jgi:hypothetical protein